MHRIKKNVYDGKWKKKIIDSIYDTIKESEEVASSADIKGTIIIFHLTNYIQQNTKGTQITKERKFDLLNSSKRAFLDSMPADMYHLTTNMKKEHTFLTIENSCPQYHLGCMAVNLFHPKEMVEYERYNIKTTLDLSHYQIYSNYLLDGRGNFGGDFG